MNDQQFRKRPVDQQAEVPPRSKRQATGQQPGRDGLRREVCAIYAAYDALHKASQGRGEPRDEDFRALLAAAAEGAQKQPPECQLSPVVLSASRQAHRISASPTAAAGSPAGRCLAARLLPRFASLFAAQLDEAADALTSLACLSLDSAPRPGAGVGVAGGSVPAGSALDESARRDALTGLVQLVAAAASEGARVGTVIKVVEFAFL